MDEIDAMGGTLRAIEKGFVQTEIQNAAFESQQAIETGKRIIVGVNRFSMEGNAAIPTFRLDPELEKTQQERLREVRASRSNSDVEARLREVEKTARTSANLMPVILAAADVYATVGEISDALKVVFGEYKEGS